MNEYMKTLNEKMSQVMVEIEREYKSTVTHTHTHVSSSVSFSASWPWHKAWIRLSSHGWLLCLLFSRNAISSSWIPAFHADILHPYITVNDRTVFS